MSTPETPPWPSLYDPSIDLLRIAHNDPLQPNGHYLTDADGASFSDSGSSNRVTPISLLYCQMSSGLPSTGPSSSTSQSSLSPVLSPSSTSRSLQHRSIFHIHLSTLAINLNRIPSLPSLPALPPRPPLRHSARTRKHPPSPTLRLRGALLRKLTRIVPAPPMPSLLYSYTLPRASWALS